MELLTIYTYLHQLFTRFHKYKSISITGGIYTNWSSKIYAGLEKLDFLFFILYLHLIVFRIEVRWKNQIEGHRILTNQSDKDSMQDNFSPPLNAYNAFFTP